MTLHIHRNGLFSGFFVTRSRRLETIFSYDDTRRGTTQFGFVEEKKTKKYNVIFFSIEVTKKNIDAPVYFYYYLTKNHGRH